MAPAAWRVALAGLLAVHACGPQPARWPQYPLYEKARNILATLRPFEGRLSLSGRHLECDVRRSKGLIRKADCQSTLPAEALRQAEARAQELTPVTLTGRKDLRKVPFLTIDPVDARDHDDAIYVEKRPEGYRAYVAIADVSEYVQPGSAIDADASERCFTTYLPDRAVPMLPAVLASQHCSLLPNQDRYALVAIVGHEPTLSSLLARLVEGESADRFAFKKGGAALVDLPAGPRAAGRLVWFVKPRILRYIGSD